MEELISLFCYQNLDFPKLTLLFKTLKAARLAMADRVVLNRTNTELFAANTRKKQRAQRTGIQYDGQGARVLNARLCRGLVFDDEVAAQQRMRPDAHPMQFRKQRRVQDSRQSWGNVRGQF